MKQLISILLALTVVGGVLAGCAAEEGGGDAPAEETEE